MKPEDQENPEELRKQQRFKKKMIYSSAALVAGGGLAWLFGKTQKAGIIGGAVAFAASMILN